MSLRVYLRCSPLGPSALVLTALILTTLGGCQKTDPIVTYRVPTKVPEQLLPGKDRMLAAIAPHESKAWFFKVTGPEDAIASIEDEFQTFVKNVAFKDGNPDLSALPRGWRRAGEKPFRYASIDVNVQGEGNLAGKQLDISISNLTKQENWDSYVAMNVNRWRGQLGLKNSDEKWAGAEPIDIASADGESVWVDIVGDPSQSSRSMAGGFASEGFASGRPMAAPFAGGAAAPPASQASNATQRKSKLKFDTPDGWRKGKMSMMRLAAFNVGPEDAEAVVTVMPAGGDLRPNIARWIGQIRQGNVPDEVVDKALADAEKVTVSDIDAKRYVLTGENPDEGEAIDATIVPLENGQSMFIKMTGPAATVSAQNDAMVKFLKSLKF
jgi:hypothetical protein